MISRHWKAIARPGQGERYVAHLRSEVFPKLAAIPGFVRATVLKRSVEAGTEFQVVTVWESLRAIEAFAGPKPELAVVPAVVQAMMSDYDRQVAHYEIADTYTP
jgi:heme-degrading monooxygenase HmoA